MTKMALNRQNNQSIATNQLMEQLKLAVGRNQELEYLVQTKEMKINLLVQEMGQHVEQLNYKDAECVEM